MKWTKTVCSYCLIEVKYDEWIPEYRIQIEEITKLTKSFCEIIRNPFSNCSTEGGNPPLPCGGFYFCVLLFKIKSSMQRRCALPQLNCLHLTAEAINEIFAQKYTHNMYKYLTHTHTPHLVQAQSHKTNPTHSLQI